MYKQRDFLDSFLIETHVEVWQERWVMHLLHDWMSFMWFVAIGNWKAPRFHCFSFTPISGPCVVSLTFRLLEPHV